MNRRVSPAESLSPEAKRALLAQLLRQKAIAPKQCLASFAQERLWFLNQLAPELPLYTVPLLLRLSGPLDVVALEHSVNEIVRRHETLRTTFVVEAGRLNQVIAPALTIPLSRTDLRALPVEQRAVEAERSAQAEARRLFDLATGPLLRVHLWVLDIEEHLLLLNIDHRVADEWSFRVFFRELSALYTAGVQGHPPPLTELSLQYADYSRWQRQWLQGEEAERQKAYWRKQLSNAPLQLELPTDWPRPAAQTYGGAAHPFSLSSELSQALQEFSRQAGVTLFMTLLTAFQVLLFRYTGQVDLCVGIPVAHRTQAELENLIGLFLNTVVIRANLAGNPTFREMLRRVQKLCVDAYVHQDLPFEQVVQELQLERRLSQSPLFQVMFVLQNDLEETLHLPQVIVQKKGINPDVAKFDLTLSLVETGQGLRGWWEYNTDLFDSTTLARWTEHFRVLLESVLADPNQHLATLPLLAPNERRLLEKWNATLHEYPRGKCLPELFDTLVAQNPEAITLVFKTDQLTYAALNERANQLAHYLRGQGVGPEVLVGLCVERSLEMVIGVLGILKAGGAYVPLDPTYPLERLAFMLNDSKVQLLLTQAQLLNRLPKYTARIICLDTDWPEIAQAARKEAILESIPSLPSLTEISPENLAYVIYTSGSTGQPKGVAVSHRGIGNLAVVQVQALGICPADRILQFSSFSFDACVWEIVMALLSGAPLCLVPVDQLFPGPPLLEVLREQAISLVTLPPSVLTALPPSPLPALQTLIVAGKPVRLKWWSAGVPGGVSSMPMAPRS
jgi:non-ribosomal peptide synthetase component F